MAITWEKFKHYLKTYQDILNIAASDRLIEWSTMDLSNALGWARLLEDTVDGEREEGLQAEYERDAAEFPQLSWKKIIAAQHILLRTMMNNPVLVHCPSLGKHFLQAYFNLVETKEDLPGAVDQLVQDLTPIVRAVALSNCFHYLFSSSSTLSEPSSSVFTQLAVPKTSAFYYQSANIPKRTLAKLLSMKLKQGLISCDREYSQYLQTEPGFLEIVAFQVLSSFVHKSSQSAPALDDEMHAELVRWLINALESAQWPLSFTLLGHLCVAENLILVQYLQFLNALLLQARQDAKLWIELIKRLTKLAKRNPMMHQKVIHFIQSQFINNITQ